MIVEKFKKNINEKIILENKVTKLSAKVKFSIDKIYKTLKKGGKIFLCGNGGSAADAQHLSAEFLVRLRPHVNRKPFPVISLALDTSTITACGNDFGYDVLYERLVSSIGKKGDCLIGITTSGNSNNIIKAMQTAKNMNIKVYGFLGSGGGNALQYCDEALLYLVISQAEFKKHI